MPLLTIDEFAGKVKSKYPEYRNVPNGILADKVLAKYPEYQKAVDFKPVTEVKPAAVPSETQLPIADLSKEPTLRAPRVGEQVRELTTEANRELSERLEAKYLKKNATPEMKMQTFVEGVTRASPLGLISRAVAGEKRFPAEDKTLKRAFPGYHLMGNITGDIMTIVSAFSVAGAKAAQITGPLAKKLTASIPSLNELYPTVQRVLSGVFRDAFIGAGVGAGKEALEQAAERKLELPKIGKEAVKTGAAFAPFGVVPYTKIGIEGGVKGALKRSGAAAGVVGSATTAITLLDDKKISQDDMVNIAANSLSAAILQGIGQRQIAQMNRNAEIADFFDRKTLAKVKENNPNLSESEAKAITTVINNGISVTPPAVVRKMEGKLSPVKKAISEFEAEHGIKVDFSKERIKLAETAEVKPGITPTEPPRIEPVEPVAVVSPVTTPEPGKPPIPEVSEPAKAKEPWEMTNIEYVKSIIPSLASEITQFVPSYAAQHKVEIRMAISEGKTVPPEVLADYPELVSGKPEVKPSASEIPETKVLPPTPKISIPKIRKTGKPQDIVQFARKNKVNPNKSESSDIKQLGRMDFIDTKNGKSLDYVTERAIEHGFLPAGSVGSDYIELIDNQIKTGRKKYSIEEREFAEEQPTETMNLETLNEKIRELRGEMAGEKINREKQLRLADLLETKERLEAHQAQRKEFEKAKEIPVGDKLKIEERGEIHDMTVESVAESGDVKLVNDITKKADIFTTLNVIEKKSGGIKQTSEQIKKEAEAQQEQFVMKGLPEGQMPEKPIEVKKEQVASTELLEGLEPEIEQPELKLGGRKVVGQEENSANKIAEIIRSSKSMSEAKEKISKELGVELTYDDLKKYEVMLKGGLPPDMSDPLISHIEKKIENSSKSKGSTADVDYGTEKIDIDPKELEDSIGFLDIAKDKIKEVVKSFRKLSLTQNYLYLNLEGKPIAEGVTDAHVKELEVGSKVDALHRLIRNANNKKKIADILVEADRRERIDGDRENVIGIVKKEIAAGTMTEKDLVAIKAIGQLRKIAKEQLITDILDSHLGIKVKFNGDKYTVKYTLKGGETKTAENVTLKQLNYFNSKFTDVEVLDKKGEYIFRRADTKTGQYVSEKKLISDYENEVPKLLEEKERSLVAQLLPYVNYIPHNRVGGNYWVDIYEKLASGEELKILSTRVPNMVWADKLKEAAMKNTMLRVEVNPHTSSHIKIPSIGTYSDLQYSLSEKGIPPESEAGQKILNAYRSMSPLLSSMIHATNIAGYRVDFDGIVEGMLLKAKSAGKRGFRSDVKDLYPAISEIKDPFTKEVAEKYVTALTSTVEGKNNILDASKSLTYFYLLTNSPTYVVQNLSEPIWAIARIPKLNSASVFWSVLSAEYKNLLNRAVESGIIKAPFSEQALGKGILNKLDILGRWSEGWSSKKVFEIGLRIARDRKLSGDEAYRAAYQFLLNVGKPFYSNANTLIGLLDKSNENINRYGFIFLRWSYDWYNKTATMGLPTFMKSLLFWLLLGGVTGIPFGRKILSKLGLVDVKKPIEKLTAEERLMLGGVPAMMGISSKFLIPALTVKGIEGVGNPLRSISILNQKVEQAKKAYDKYGVYGLIGGLPLGGFQYPIRAISKVKEGYIHNKKTFYAPLTAIQKAIVYAGFQPFEVQEFYARMSEEEEKALKRPGNIGKPTLRKKLGKKLYKPVLR